MEVPVWGMSDGGTRGDCWALNYLHSTIQEVMLLEVLNVTLLFYFQVEVLEVIVEVLNVTLLSYFQVEVLEGIVEVLNVTLLSYFQVEVPEGALACWVFLSCLEVLNVSEKHSDKLQIDKYSLYTASLWDHARKKVIISFL